MKLVFFLMKKKIKGGQKEGFIEIWMNKSTHAHEQIVREQVLKNNT